MRRDRIKRYIYLTINGELTDYLGISADERSADHGNTADEPRTPAIHLQRKELQGHADPTMLRLFRFLELVWVYTADKPFTEQTIYDLYCGKLPPREASEQAPPGDLSPVKAEFFARAQEKSNICNGPFKLDPEAVVKVIRNNLEFRSPCNVGAITDRLYVNVRMQHAVAVMRFIALEVVLGETGISYAKIADPLELCLDLFDRIVVYSLHQKRRSWLRAKCLARLMKPISTRRPRT